MKLPSSSFVFSSSLILLSSLLLLGKSTARVPLQLIEFISLIDEDVAVLISGAFSFNQIICRRLGGSSFNKCSFSRLIYNIEAVKQLSLAIRGADVNKQSNFNTKNYAVAWLVTKQSKSLIYKEMKLSVSNNVLAFIKDYRIVVEPLSEYLPNSTYFSAIAFEPI
jgi:hypothetical protein